MLSPPHTHTQSGRITAVAAVEDEASVASASASGSVHVWRVEVTHRSSSSVGAAAGGGGEKYLGVVGKRQLSPGEGAVMDVQQWGPHLLMYVTQRGGVHAWDLRAKQDVWLLRCRPALGLTEHMVTDMDAGSAGGAWLLTGTNRGHMCLWDIRFGMNVHTWQHPLRCPLDCIAVASAPACRLHG